ncbi:hypothetical protein SEMRO_856_G211520.1 [Seminavis robusta]|uniref:Uncharacterized protein n=1 Tax=Seminavis robusta TaxID=568900 RepID=A0A9N8EF73_9STRA|nr:hypothetical protein SEMRO_856_G211520.1 [Seminavis robusta]|eukprot:Sro856_g211520.1 n/a (231) ;mRNA; f:9650-10342
MSNHEQALQWISAMDKIRESSFNLGPDGVESWLEDVKRAADHWGNNRIPPDIKNATNVTEDTWASRGNSVTPVFRHSIPKYVNAVREFTHSVKTSTFHHSYKAKNGDLQSGEGVPRNRMTAHKRNKLEFVEITYFQLDGTPFTIRTTTIQSGYYWHMWIRSFWERLSEILDAPYDEKNNHYRRHLVALNAEVQERGHGFFPESVRAVIHELQDRFDEPRTHFDPVVNATP